MFFIPVTGTFCCDSPTQSRALILSRIGDPKKRVGFSPTFPTVSSKIGHTMVYPNFCGLSSLSSHAKFKLLFLGTPHFEKANHGPILAKRLGSKPRKPADRVGRAEHFEDVAYHLYVDMPVRSLGAKCCWIFR